MPTCFCATDLHGITSRYEKLFQAIRGGHPDVLFLGGDLLAHVSFTPNVSGHDSFVEGYLIPAFSKIRIALGEKYPHIFVILGNDDLGYVEKDFLAAEAEGLWHYMHAKRQQWRAADLIDTRRGIRRYREEPEADHSLTGNSEAVVAESRPTEVQGWHRFPICDETHTREVKRG